MARPRRTSAASETSTVMESQQELGSMYDYLAKVILLGPSGTGKSCVLHRFVHSSWRVLSSQTIGVEFASKIVRIGTGARRRRIKLQLWDTAGTERFRSVSRSYYRGAAGAILVYDVASMASFNSLPTFLMDAKALASPQLTMILAGNKNDLANDAGIPVARPGAENRSIPDPSLASSVSSRQSSFPFDAGGVSVGTAATTSSTRSRGGSINLETSKHWTASTSTEGREVPADVASHWASQSGIPVAVEVSALSGENIDELFNRLARMILTKIELGEIDPDNPQSGIQYGDSGGGVGGGWDGSSVKSGGTYDEDGTVRRRTGRRRGGGGGGGNLLFSGVTEWEEVFRHPGSRRGRCC